MYIFGVEEGSHGKEEYVSYCYRSLDTNCGTVAILDLEFRFSYRKNENRFLFKQSSLNYLKKIISQISKLISKFVNVFSSICWFLRMVYCI